MIMSLQSFPKTVPSNHKVLGIEVQEAGAEVPGYSLTPDQFAKAQRMEHPDYDWNGYQKSASRILFDHPSLAHREHEESQLMEWNAILNDLEPFNQRPY